MDAHRIEAQPTHIERLWLSGVLHRPGGTIGICLLLALALASGARFLIFDTNYRVFFSQSNPELKTLDAFEKNYTQSDNVLIVVRPPHGELFSPEALSVVEDLTKKAWSIPNAIRVDSLTNFQDTWADDDTLVVEPLVRDAADLTPQMLHTKRARALAEPLLKNSLISADATTTGINVTIQYPLLSTDEVPQTVHYARKLVADAQAQHPDYQFALSGLILLNNAFAETGEGDMETLVPAMYMVLALAAMFIVRSLVAAVATLAVIALSTVVAMGCAGYLNIPLSPIAAAAPTIILTLAVADSLHIILSTLTQMRAGMTKREALAHALRTNFVAVTITSVTTAIGFLTLNFAESPVFWHLGIISAIGIAAGWLFSLTLLPALLTLLPLRARATPSSSEQAGHRLGRLAEAMVKHRHAVIISAIIATLALVGLAPSMRLDDNFVKYFDYDIPFRSDVEFTMAHLTGTYRVEFSVPAGHLEGVNDPTYLQHLEDFTLWLRKQPVVRHVYSYSDIIKRVNMNMHGDDPQSYTVPTEQPLAAQYLLLYELSLPYGLGLNDRIVLDRSATRVTVTLNDISMADVRRFNQLAAHWMATHWPAGMMAQPTGVAVMFSHISQRNIEGMLVGNALGLLLISVLLMFMLRSVRLGVISAFTNIAPIAMSFGVWAAISGEIGMAAATVAAVSLGIIVDDTVHFLNRYRNELQAGKSNSEAIVAAASTVGRAVLTISFIMMAGFVVLGLSSFRVNVQMGLLTAVALGLGSLFTLLVTPALLAVGHTAKEQAG